uniref:Uncharacterized protein n=1 Tax=mine drainage metagenome TaxID=410659 RepID=E6PSG8_9ZZZZ
MSATTLYTPASTQADANSATQTKQGSAPHPGTLPSPAGVQDKASQNLPSFVINQALEFMQKQASTKGVSVSKTEILFTIAQDPKGNAAKRFEALCDLGFKVVLN